jgi:hypothetical protein
MICKHFFPFCGVFHFLSGIFWSTKVFNFDDVQFIIFLLLLLLLVSYLRNHYLTQVIRIYIPVFSSDCFIVLAVIFIST